MLRAPEVANERKCKTCKWWEQDVFGDAWGWCNRASEWDKGITTLARAMGCDGYPALLDTNEQFSCVQWEAKEGA